MDPQQAQAAPSPGGHGKDGDDPPPSSSHPAQAFHDAMQRLAEAREFAAYYIAARIDALKATARKAAILAALGVVGLLAAAAVLVTAIVLVLQGIAGAFAILVGGREWLGALITGVLVILVLVAVILIGMKWLSGSSRRKTVQKYENRQSQQRQRFGGRDVQSEATAAHSSRSDSV